jgi:hypothetical protein
MANSGTLVPIATTVRPSTRGLTPSNAQVLMLPAPTMRAARHATKTINPLTFIDSYAPLHPMEQKLSRHKYSAIVKNIIYRVGVVMNQTAIILVYKIAVPPFSKQVVVDFPIKTIIPMKFHYPHLFYIVLIDFIYYG